MLGGSQGALFQPDGCYHCPAAPEAANPRSVLAPCLNAPELFPFARLSVAACRCNFCAARLRRFSNWRSLEVLDWKRDLESADILGLLSEFYRNCKTLRNLGTASLPLKIRDLMWTRSGKWKFHSSFFHKFSSIPNTRLSELPLVGRPRHAENLRCNGGQPGVCSSPTGSLRVLAENESKRTIDIPM